MLNYQRVLCYHDIPHNIAIFIGKSTVNKFCYGPSQLGPTSAGVQLRRIAWKQIRVL